MRPPKLRVLAHISDLHFGAVDGDIVAALAASIRDSSPDLLVVSGDLTQRARAAQFLAARSFLQSLPLPKIIVPGNHDVPLYNVFARWLSPLSKYCRYISQDLQPFYADREIAVQGLNTARSLTLKDGRLNVDQVRQACSRFNRVENYVTRILVTHHPFRAAPTEDEDDVGRSAMALAGFAECGVEIILSGHHHSSVARVSTVPVGAGYPALMIQAGTATSNRLRGEQNSYNILRIEGRSVSVQRMSWQPQQRAFKISHAQRFFREQGWHELPASAVSAR